PLPLPSPPPDVVAMTDPISSPLPHKSHDANPAEFAVIGAGVVGGGWASRALLSGRNVAIYDPNPNAPAQFDALLANAKLAWGQRYPRHRGNIGTHRFCSSIADAVAHADFVQESVGENPALKTAVIDEICAHKPGGAVVATSTSGIRPSVIQEGMTNAAMRQDVVVGHPFVPVYLLPLVEVVGGAHTSQNTIDRALETYASLGMTPLPIDQEIDGFIADRLLEAVWREALWLVHDGIATTTQIDAAITGGAGLRWSFMGSFLAYRIAGGPQGMTHFLQQFGPALKWPWTHLMDVPTLDDALIEKIVAQSDAQAAAHPFGGSTHTLEQWRDRRLCAVQNALDGVADEERLVPITTELATCTAQITVPEAWIDYNDHMTESRYLQLISDNTDRLLEQLGMGATYATATACGFSTVHTSLDHLAASSVEEPLTVTSRALRRSAKRLVIETTVCAATPASVDPDTDALGARGLGETKARAVQTLVHTDNRARRSVAMSAAQQHLLT
nr:hypothetical protein [Alphaproteobacteria bacterium]